PPRSRPHRRRHRDLVHQVERRAHGRRFLNTNGFPFVDLKSGGSVVGMIHAIDSLLPQIPRDAKIIPGHGEVATVDELRKYRATLEEIVEAVKKGLHKGKTVE